MGDPDPRLVDAHPRAAERSLSWQVASEEQARAAEAAGADLVVAQGVEAGGHLRGELGLLPLLDAVLDAVDVPVVAAGGIGSARSPLAAVLAAGASRGPRRHAFHRQHPRAPPTTPTSRRSPRPAPTTPCSRARSAPATPSQTTQRVLASGAPKPPRGSRHRDGR